jgi:hypothetical protein
MELKPSTSASNEKWLKLEYAQEDEIICLCLGYEPFENAKKLDECIQSHYKNLKSEYFELKNNFKIGVACNKVKPLGDSSNLFQIVEVVLYFHSKKLRVDQFLYELAIRKVQNISDTHHTSLSTSNPFLMELIRLDNKAEEENLDSSQVSYCIAQIMNSKTKNHNSGTPPQIAKYLTPASKNFAFQAKLKSLSEVNL